MRRMMRRKSAKKGGMKSTMRRILMLERDKRVPLGSASLLVDDENDLLYSSHSCKCLSNRPFFRFK